MRRIHTIVIGGGQAGLAMSRCLSDRSIEHVVFERGRIAERWRSERWDSLRLLTPNWQTRLPGFRYDGPDPDGYMSMPELVSFFERYAASLPASVEAGTAVWRVERAGPLFRVATSRDTWLAHNVVIATGYSDVAAVPRMSRRLSPRVLQIVPSAYRNPEQLPHGGVLVVGASATGIQLAEEIHASGRPVTLSVGRHLRLPRTYRGRDILWWLDRMGVFDETTADVFDIRRSRSQPSLQLIGRSGGAPLHLETLRRSGVRVLGRLVELDEEQARFDDDLIATTSASDIKLAELLMRIDAYIGKTAPSHAVAAEPFEPTWTVADGTGEAVLDLRAEGIETVLWATGFARTYSWLAVPVLDIRGEIVHREGMTGAPGLFVLGMHFQRRRKSAFIDGVGDDAAFIAGRIVERERSTPADVGPAWYERWASSSR